jgi:hypothetical protein
MANTPNSTKYSIFLYKITLNRFNSILIFTKNIFYNLSLLIYKDNSTHPIFKMNYNFKLKKIYINFFCMLGGQSVIDG